MESPTTTYSLCPTCHDNIQGYTCCPQLECQSGCMCVPHPLGTCYVCGKDAEPCESAHYIYDETCCERERVYLCADHHHPHSSDNHAAELEAEKELEDMWKDNEGVEIGTK